MASESEQGHVDCTVKRRTRLVRITFVGSSVQSLTNSNRRIRNRTYGGVGGADERLSPLSRSRRVRSQRAARVQRGEKRHRTRAGGGGGEALFPPLPSSRRVRSQRPAGFQRGKTRLGMSRDGSLRGSIPL